jgi:thymidylate synthase
MSDFYKPYAERSPDSQYRDRLRFILEHGVTVQDTPQGVGALTCFGSLPPMVFDLSNGIPVITDRKIGFWRKPIAEIVAFINGARTVEQIESFGCDFWKDYREKGPKLGLDPGDLGPGSYGAAFHDFETPYGQPLNQFAQVIEQIGTHPHLRTHLVTPWKPYYTARGPNRKVIVAPCHGWLHFRVIDGRLHMRMDQRSADFPVGVPSNMVQYAALLLMMSRKTGYSPGTFVHSFSDAHIYANQIEKVRELVEREPRRLPTLRLDDDAPGFFDIRPEHFTLDHYDPHPPMQIPYTP